MLHIISTRCENVAIELDRSGFTTIECEPAIRSRGSVGNAQMVTGSATSGALWGQAVAGRSWGTARPTMLAVQTPARQANRSRSCTRQVDPTVSMGRNGPLVGDVTGLATASPATGPGWRALGRARQVGRRRPGRVPRMLAHPGFENPDAFLQPAVRRAEVNDHRPQLSNGCLQGGDHGWHHSTERGRNSTPHPTPVNGYGLIWHACTG